MKRAGAEQCLQAPFEGDQLAVSFGAFKSVDRFYSLRQKVLYIFCTHSVLIVWSALAVLLRIL